MREIPCGTRAFVNEFGINSHLLYFQESLFIVGAHVHSQQEEEAIYCAFFDTFIFHFICTTHFRISKKHSKIAHVIITGAIYLLSEISQVCVCVDVRMQSWIHCSSWGWILDEESRRVLPQIWTFFSPQSRENRDDSAKMTQEWDLYIKLLFSLLSL